MARNKENDYFELFVKGVSCACDAAELLCRDFTSYVPEELPERIKEIHHIEHLADTAKHDMMHRLAKEFITPIDREDIMDLAGIIDDVTDSIDDIMMRAYMFNIKVPRPEAVEFAKIILDCCTALKGMMEEFSNFRKSKTIHEKIVEINGLEETGDKLYTEATRRLYTESAAPIEVIAWTALFERMEKCCDACEHVADVVERVIMKNS